MGGEGGSEQGGGGREEEGGKEGGRGRPSTITGLDWWTGLLN